MLLVTPAEPRHIAPLVALLAEMNRFYGEIKREPLEELIPQITDALFGEVSAASALLAWDDTELVGLTTYSFLWPAAGVTRSLYLKELYVSEARRRRGIGRLLMHRVCELAVKHDCSRVEWTADRDNAEAQRFYELLGVPQTSSKLFYRLEEEPLRRVAEG